MRAHEIITELSRPKDRVIANEILLKAGYRLMGAGSFASVYEKAGAAYVLKLFDADDAAYRDFVSLVKGHPNPHFPKFFGNPIKVSDGFYAMKMEKLTPYRGDPSIIAVYCINRDIKLDPNSYTAMQMGDVEEFFYDKQYFKEALDLIIDNLLTVHRGDFKADNFMMRGSTIVITDPVANKVTLNQDRPVINAPAYPSERPARAKWKDDELNKILDDELFRQLLGAE